MKPSVIVWDLETAPDLAGFAVANNLVGKADADIREVLGNKFPKHIYHTIVCIGALVACRESDRWTVDALGAPHVGERSEKQLISAFCDKIAELTPQLVTFNGNSFDLPVLRYRSMTWRLGPGASCSALLQPIHRGRGRLVRHSLFVRSSYESLVERAQQDHGDARKAREHRR
jgi:predicted PolB exonuclease-like 3'-5' exonuclease